MVMSIGGRRHQSFFHGIKQFSMFNIFVGKIRGVLFATVEVVVIVVVEEVVEVVVVGLSVFLFIIKISIFITCIFNVIAITYPVLQK